jgi:hypothetical protein
VCFLVPACSLRVVIRISNGCWHAPDSHEMDVDAWSEEADDDHLFAALGITAAAQQDVEQAVLDQVSAWTCLCDGQQAPVLKCSLMLCAVVVPTGIHRSQCSCHWWC